MTSAPYAPEGRTRKRGGNHPGVHTKKGRKIQCGHRQILLRVPAEQYQEWLRASGAEEYRDLRNWLICLADREAQASDPRLIINPS